MNKNLSNFNISTNSTWDKTYFENVFLQNQGMLPDVYDDVSYCLKELEPIKLILKEHGYIKIRCKYDTFFINKEITTVETRNEYRNLVNGTIVVLWMDLYNDIECIRGIAVFCKPNSEYNSNHNSENNLLIDSLRKSPNTKEEKKTNINLLCSDSKLYLNPMKISNIDVDLELNYNDGFKEYSDLIVKELNESNKGLFILHGVKGTGKTSYIKYLINNIDKKIIFIPAYMADQLSSPNILTFLTGHTNSVLVIEEAEEILKSRNSGVNHSISNILNISDGILSDVLQIQIICTFNCNVSKIDEALLRKGRLKAMYEFKDLTVDKAQKKSDSLGFTTKILSPMSLSDVYNQDKQGFEINNTKSGFIK